MWCSQSDRKLTRCGLRVMVALSWIAVAGCTTQQSRFEIVEHQASGQPRHYAETFDEAYYDLDEHGNVNVVLRCNAPSETEPYQTVTQVVHLRSFWRSIPGRTVAHDTQINGLATYYILSGQIGAAFEGAGSVFFSENRDHSEIEGSLDLAILHPTRRLAAGSPIFDKVELSGGFTARHEPRQVRRIVNEIERQFGPE